MHEIHRSRHGEEIDGQANLVSDREWVMSKLKRWQGLDLVLEAQPGESTANARDEQAGHRMPSHLVGLVEAGRRAVSLQDRTHHPFVLPLSDRQGRHPR